MLIPRGRRSSEPYPYQEQVALRREAAIVVIMMGRTGEDRLIDRLFGVFPVRARLRGRSQSHDGVLLNDTDEQDDSKER